MMAVLVDGGRGSLDLCQGPFLDERMLATADCFKAHRRLTWPWSNIGLMVWLMW